MSRVATENQPEGSDKVIVRSSNEGKRERL